MTANPPSHLIAVGSEWKGSRPMTIIVVAALAAALVSPVGGSAPWNHGPCNGWYSTPSPSDSNVSRQVAALITCAERAFPVAAGLGTVLAIAERESGLSPWARNPSSGTCGIFQSMPALWPGRAATLPRAWFPAYLQPLSCFNARANVLWAVRSMAQSGLGPWGG